jgi:hypothetical protein
MAFERPVQSAADPRLSRPSARPGVSRPAPRPRSRPQRAGDRPDGSGRSSSRTTGATPRTLDSSITSSASASSATDPRRSWTGTGAQREGDQGRRAGQRPGLVRRRAHQHPVPDPRHGGGGRFQHLAVAARPDGVLSPPGLRGSQARHVDRVRRALHATEQPRRLLPQAGRQAEGQRHGADTVLPAVHRRGGDRARQCEADRGAARDAPCCRSVAAPRRERRTPSWRGQRAPPSPAAAGSPAARPSAAGAPGAGRGRPAGPQRCAASRRRTPPARRPGRRRAAPAPRDRRAAAGLRAERGRFESPPGG